MNHVIPKSRHLKLACLRPEMIMEMFRRPRLPEADGEVVVVRSHHFADLPEDVRVEGVYWNYSYSAWDVLLSHPSWPEVPFGEVVGRLEPRDCQRMIIRDTRLPAPEAGGYKYGGLL